ncbi:CD209 antigen-like protein D [Latimeria chalumnae]|uniref:CD209 antigen-like protein D n=1 Tax=Latimeria chalumnae TaxID=7897 RepID=UPI00313AE6E0
MRCEEMGSHLAVINTQEEESFIEKRSQGSWIGLTDMNSEGTWDWVDGSNYTTLPKFWGNNEQPDNFNGDEDCVTICGINCQWFKRGWNDENCEKKFGMVCEK